MTKANSTKKQKQSAPTASTNSRPELRIDWATHEAAKYAVENWHYSKRMPKSKLAKFGVWEDGRFIGVVIFGVGGTPGMFSSYGLKSVEGCELVRIALTRHKTEVSRIVAICIRLLKVSFPGLRLIVSFADSEQGHHGGIYQAGNWLMAGSSSSSDEYIYKGKRWHGRAFRHRFKGLEKSTEVTIVKGSKKLRYLMPLDDEMRKQIEPLRKPYPKRVRSVDSDTSAIHAEMGGANPTRTLSIPPEE